MHRLASLAAASLVGAIAACAGRAPAPATPSASSAADASVDGDASPGAERPDERPRGRPAGIRALDINGQRTYWVEHCPTDSSSPLREPCSMTRVDPSAE